MSGKNKIVGNTISVKTLIDNYGKFGIPHFQRGQIWKEKNKHSILTIPFEKFVLDPWLYLKEIEEKLETKIGSKTNKMLRK